MDLKKVKTVLTKNIDYLICLIVFILVFGIYIRSLAPSILPGDPAEFIIVSYVLGIPHSTGYPLYTWIGHLFTYIPIGSIAYRVNLMSAFFGAATVSLIYFIVLKILSKITSNLSITIIRFISIITAISLAFSKIFWFQSEIAEVYVFNAFFIALMILILLKWSENKEIKLLYLFSLIYGLSSGAHMSNIFLAPAFIIFIFMNDRSVFLEKKNLFLFIFLFSIGISQFIYLFIRSYQYPEFNHFRGSLNLTGLWNIATAKEFSSMPFSIPSSQFYSRFLMFIDFLKGNFFTPSLIIGLIGIWKLFKKDIKTFLLLFLMFLVYMIFYIPYGTAGIDLETMFVPSFLLFSIFIGIGIFAILNFIKSKLNLPIKGGTLQLKNIAFLFMVFSIIIIPSALYSINYDKIDQYKNIDDSFYSRALNTVPENSIIISDWSDYTTYKYFQIVYNLNSNINVTCHDETYWLGVIGNSNNSKNVFIVRTNNNISNKYNATIFLENSESKLYKIDKN